MMPATCEPKYRVVENALYLGNYDIVDADGVVVVAHLPRGAAEHEAASLSNPVRQRAARGKDVFGCRISA